MRAPPRRDSGHGPGKAVIATRDGALSFELSVLPTGVFLTRVQRRPGTGSTTHTTKLEGLDAFEKLHEADPARHEQPQLFVQIRRELAKLFANHAEERGRT
jgi:hypothetical protein